MPRDTPSPVRLTSSASSPRHPLAPSLRFALAGLLLTTASRLLLVVWQWPRVRAEAGLWPVMLGGLRIDLSLVAIVCLPMIVLAPWLAGHGRAARAFGRAQSAWLALAFVLLALLEAATPSFVLEFGSRPNRLFFEYLGSPREVLGTLWGAYRGGLAVAALASACALAVSVRLFAARPGARLRPGTRALCSVAGGLLALLAARGGLQHRPINPAMVAFCDDALVNALAVNSLYGVGYDAFSLGDEERASAVYGSLPEAEMNERVRACAGLVGPPLDPRLPSLHHQTPAVDSDRRPNLVLIVEESLGARFVGSLGGMDLTPNLDRLSAQGWWFTRFYATGTRSARGLEAIATGFPPSPARPVLKLRRAQHGFFTLAALLRQRGYATRFVYGGEGHFDNMQGFFLANGFHEAVDGSDYDHPVFRGTWGVSDEDVFDRVHQVLLESGDRPSFLLVFSASNHSPWEFPDGRIELHEEPKATMHNAVKYADWALGRFVDRTLAAPYGRRTLIAVVADHDVRCTGAGPVPIEGFHIPALILGPRVPVRVDGRLASQIDLAPTLLSLMGIESTHPMIGRDQLRLAPDDPGRAILQYQSTYAFWRGDDVLVLQPRRDPLEFRESHGLLEPEPLDADLARTALAHALWSSWAYREERYVLGDRSTSREPRTGTR